MKVLDLAEYVIRHASEKEKAITNLKLQKTLYYLQGYSLRVFDEPAFDSDIRNWQYGPVAPTAYFAYSSYGAFSLEENDEIVIEQPSKDKMKLFNKVIDACLKIPARTLVQMTHNEEPWKNTRPNEEITQEAITRFFCNNNPLDLKED